ncbi:hypothetical protein KW782_03920 [Candidatus Parcubacteria bacterium]|nr:hypothetical protein [Candidatus Parcubacteria bacterium]
MQKKLREKASTLSDIALYYGFTPVNPIHPEKIDFDLVKGYVPSDEEEIPLHLEEQLTILRTQFSKGQQQLPLSIARERKPVRTGQPGGSAKKDGRKCEYCLDIIGTTRSIADAIVIKTAYEMIREEYGNAHVEINSLGDKESLARFQRELTLYFKKHLGDLDPECRQRFKKSAFDAMLCGHEKCQEIKRGAPHPMNYLSEPSRIHFKEVLEHLEMAALPYDINTCLVPYHHVASHTVFRILAEEEGKPEQFVAASGARWTGLARKLGFKKDIPGVTAIVSLKKTPIQKTSPKTPKPQFYFIQMGQEAKLRSLSLIETLRQARIPVYHSLIKDKLTAQLMTAEHLKVPFILIMGQKESIENTVLVREMHNRSQETIRVEIIAEYLRKLIR